MRLSIVYPVFDTASAIVPPHLLDELRTEDELLIVRSKGIFLSFPPSGLRCDARVRVVSVDTDSLLSLWDRGWQEARGDGIVFAAPYLTFSSSLLGRVVRAFDSPQIGLVYSDYAELLNSGKRVERPALIDESDFCEGSDIGYLFAVRGGVREAVGGFDTKLRFAALYDLRLRIGEKFKFRRIAEPLYELVLPSSSRKATLDRWFEGVPVKLSGCDREVFSYLFYEGDRTKEIESVFRRAIARRGVALTHANPRVCCPHQTNLVSVVILNLNRVDLIRQAIDSVLAGSYRNFEVIVVDNGSTDGAIEVVEGYAKKDPRVSLLHHRPNHLARAFNAGLARARGRYVVELDSDDLFTPDALEVAVDFMEQNKGYALGVSYYELIDINGHSLSEEPIRHLEYDRDNILRTNGAGALRIWHRCVLDELGGFGEAHFGRYAEDYDLILRLSERYDVGRIHRVLYRYRRHAGNTDCQLDYETRYLAKTKARHLAHLRRQAINGSLAAKGILESEVQGVPLLGGEFEGGGLLRSDEGEASPIVPR